MIFSALFFFAIPDTVNEHGGTTFFPSSIANTVCAVYQYRGCANPQDVTVQQPSDESVIHSSLFVWFLVMQWFEISGEYHE